MKGPPESERRGRHLRVDPIACNGYGFCAELLPELVTLDDWGYPIIVPWELEGDLADEAATVVKICPKLALRLDD
jgi:ferredoxin